MDRNTFKELSDKFNGCTDANGKVEVLLGYDLKTLSNSQIDRLLAPLSEEDAMFLVKAISKKLK